MTLRYLITTILFMLFITQDSFASENQSLYAYLEQTQADMTTTLVITNPQHMSNVLRRYPVPALPGWQSFVRRSVINPYVTDGIWMTTLLSQSRSDFAIQIINLTTGFIRTIFLKGPPTSQEIFLWSPDGQHLAIIASIDDISDDLYVYSLREDTLVNLTQDPHRQHSMAWSADGSRLTVFTTACRLAQPLATCEQRYSLLDIYDAQTHLRTHQLDLSSLISGGTLACQPVFSPSAIAFTSYCNSADNGMLANDVYVWHFNENRVQQVTTFGEQAKYPQEGFYAVYDYAWLEDGTLLVGADYRFVASTPREGHQLLSYTPDGAIQVLSETLGAGFSVNPVTNDVILATRSSEFVMNPALDNPPIQTYRTTSALLQSDTAARLLTSEAAEMTIPGTTTMPLVWSPDGTMAYGLVVETSENGYARETGEIVFFDAATDEMRSFTPPSSGADVTIVPLGWVSAETVR